jgi:hypothetical protein
MNGSGRSRLYDGFLDAADTAVSYFAQWCYRDPLIIQPESNRQLHALQQVMYRSICHFVENYEAYRHLMPVSDAVYRILSLCKGKPYRPGTYRTDFLIDRNRKIRLIEITCRFALNGFFTSGFFNLLVDRFLDDKPNVKKIDEYTAFYGYLMDYFGNFDHVCILKGADNRNDTKYTIQIFEKAGYPVNVIAADAIHSNLHLLKDAAVIGELDHVEICKLPLDAIEAIIQSDLLNDLRTVFLIHDKRFFSVLGDDAFLGAALNPDERALLRQHLVPTYSRRMRPDLWMKAQSEKENWIIKPRALGKGIGIFAGCVTTDREWKAVFSSDEIEEMILQPFIPQRQIRGSVGEASYHDFVVGTLLFFDNHFFGPGMFRASSFPITNRVDDRKIAPLVTADTVYFKDEIIL